jgi:carbon storage regulator
MLVLMRRTYEEIVIPSLGITVRVLETRGGRVRIGIDAPDGLPIRRSELEPLNVAADVLAAGHDEQEVGTIVASSSIPAIKAG